MCNCLVCYREVFSGAISFVPYNKPVSIDHQSLLYYKKTKKTKNTNIKRGKFHIPTKGDKIKTLSVWSKKKTEEWQSTKLS